MGDGVHSYTYDAEGKVLQVHCGSTARYTYGAMDHRVRARHRPRTMTISSIPSAGGSPT